MWEFIWRIEMLWTLLMVLYIPCCIGLIIVVLLQKGKGTSFAGAFGIGSGADTVFGPRGSRSLPARVTQIMAAFFMILALVMSLMSGRVGKGIAPEKVEASGQAAGSADGSYDALLDDLGSAVEEKVSRPATAPGAPVTPVPAAAPAESTATAPPEAAPPNVTVEAPAKEPAHTEGQPAGPASGS